MSILPTQYSYTINGNLVAIIDLNQGKSVTNAIEEVVDQICTREKIDPNETRFIYRDSRGIWDGWDHKKQDFIILVCRSAAEAVEKLNQINTKP